MIITIHQPEFFPWLGFFNKVRLSDMLVIGDTVQFQRKSFQNRNRIKTANGPQWITVPIVRDFGEPINSVKIQRLQKNGIAWGELHLRALRTNYSKSPYYEQYIGIFEKIYRKNIELLAECNLEFLKAILSILGINVPIKKVSEINPTHSKTDQIIEICKILHADAYLSGIGGANYLKGELFEQNDIKLLYNNFEHPTYQQQFMKLGFLSNLSIIDLIFNEGPAAYNIIKSGFKRFELERSQKNLIANNSTASIHGV